MSIRAPSSSVTRSVPEASASASVLCSTPVTSRPSRRSHWAPTISVKARATDSSCGPSRVSLLLDDGDGGTRGVEDVGQFGGDVAAAEDDHPGGDLVQAHDGVGGLVRNAGIGDHRRNDGAAARRDDHAVGGDAFGAPLRPHLQFPLAGEARPAPQDGDPATGPPPLLPVAGVGVESVEDTFLHAWPRACLRAGPPRRGGRSPGRNRPLRR
ncbi:hypothetical protein GCM10018987_52810 [Streptomyces cremeus]